MESYRAAVVQMNSQPDFNYNLEQAYEEVRKAAKGGARLVALPENFVFLGSLEARMEQAEEIGKRTPDFLKDTAQEFGIYLLGGSYPTPAGNGKVYNCSLLVDPEGKTLARYNKIHLFDVELPEGESYRESDYVESGKNRPVVSRAGEIGNIGMSICYDLRFPELYRSLTERQAEVLCVPSAFTATTGRDHWKPLLRARAIENTAYVLAPAQTGTHGKKRTTHGHSLIVDPWGEVLADAGKEAGIATAVIDPSRLKEVRRRIPSLDHRKIF
ncbi:carbon-nitrogen hydrolase family protein [Halalkalibaculum sp. DA384]|uniref:carbon-nitrogen hydrolase family protein n=1 Tax=Halalkalibaculum sp. DA384 TaxID=3373606 RepID=UPI00375423BF